MYEVSDSDEDPMVCDNTHFTVIDECGISRIGRNVDVKKNKRI